MLSALKYLLYPKPEQEKRLNRSLLSFCDLYNQLKAEKIRRCREEYKSMSFLGPEGTVQQGTLMSTLRFKDV
jgi:hypothetical protein